MLLTIRDYLALNGGDHENARYRQAVGNVVVLVAKMHGQTYQPVEDPEFGQVNAYPVELLDEVMPMVKTVEAAAAVAKALSKPTA